MTWVNSGRKSDAFKRADHITGNTVHILRGLSVAFEAAEKTGRRFPTIWISTVKIPSFYHPNLSHTYNLLFYADSVEEVISRFNGLIPKNKVDTPKTVLIKMTAKRLRALWKDLKAVNSTYEQSKGKNNKWKVPGPIKLFDLNSIDAVMNICSKYEKISGNGKFHKERFEMLKKKKLFDESIMVEAWKYVIVDEVHTA